VNGEAWSTSVAVTGCERRLRAGLASVRRDIRRGHEPLDYPIDSSGPASVEHGARVIHWTSPVSLATLVAVPSPQERSTPM
jgi:hypothetical protein